MKTKLLAAAFGAAILCTSPAFASEVVTDIGACNDLTVGGNSCLFTGNINGNPDPSNVNSYKNAEEAYNAWAVDPTFNNPALATILLNYITDTDAGNFALYGTWTGAGGTSGTFDLTNAILNGLLPPGFVLDYFAVKGGDQFAIYKYNGTGVTGDWDTSALTNGGNNTPAISHIAFFGGVRAVPEPATWAMFLIGFGAVGYSMRRRQVSYHGVQAV